MTEPRDTAAAFAEIAEQLEHLLPIAARATITQTLSSAGMTWDDLRARLTALPPPVASPQDLYQPPPPMNPPMPPRAPSTIDPETVMSMSTEELSRFGYRQEHGSGFVGHLGYRSGPAKARTFLRLV